jgi:MFS transporter, PAT family, beta-lactamase induction signal transducer AmpG
MDKRAGAVSPWAWVPTLYFGQGLPYIIVIFVSTVIYKNLGMSNADITFYTGWLYLPWVIKPFWSPFIDHLRTKRFWIVTMQILMGVGFAAVGLTLPLAGHIKWSLILFWLIAFSSATYDIAADGFYMLGLKEHQQSFFVGIRNTFWRVAAITGQGGLVYLSGVLAKDPSQLRWAWSITLIATGVVYTTIALYHKLFMPKPIEDNERRLADAKDAVQKYVNTLSAFFRIKGVWLFILFILIYRLGEAQLTRLSQPFLLDSIEAGGLAMSNQQVGFAYGTMGMIGLIAGGVLGGIAVSKQGLRFWMWPMALAMNLPDVLYILLAKYQPHDIGLITTAITLEQFGYGFGFVAFTLYLIYFVRGENKTSHYAFATGIMALGVMIPGMLSGWIQEHLNYQNFFVWVTFCTIPGFIIIPFLKINKDFGKKKVT